MAMSRVEIPNPLDRVHKSLFTVVTWLRPSLESKSNKGPLAAVRPLNLSICSGLDPD